VIPEAPKSREAPRRSENGPRAATLEPFLLSLACNRLDVGEIEAEI
jgi:hypothetical protein